MNTFLNDDVAFGATNTTDAGLSFIFTISLCHFNASVVGEKNHNDRNKGETIEICYEP